jgi:hypothetical protein
MILLSDYHIRLIYDYSFSKKIHNFQNDNQYLRPISKLTFKVIFETIIFNSWQQITRYSINLINLIINVKRVNSKIYYLFKMIFKKNTETIEFKF